MIPAIIVIVVGFAMMTLGVALLVLGEVPFISGKRIPALRSRLIGLVLLSFLPLAFAARLGVRAIFGEDAVDGLVITWVLCGVCWFAVFAMLFRVVVPKREPRPVKAATGAMASDKNPFGEAMSEAEPVVADEAPWEEPAPEAPKKPAAVKPPPAAKSGPVPKPAAKKPARKPVNDKDPFDFS